MLSCSRCLPQQSYTTFDIDIIERVGRLDSTVVLTHPKAFSQYRHLYGRMPSWARRWVARLSLRSNRFLHFGHPNCLLCNEGAR